MGNLGLAATRRPDPLGVRAPPSLSARFYPMGFRLDLETNSRDVIEAAEESWAGQMPEFNGQPMTMRVMVSPEGDLAEPGTHHKAGSLFSVVCDRHNFAHVDLDAHVAAVYVSQTTASDHTWLRWFFVESLAYLMLNQRRVALVHAGLIAREASGVMLCGSAAAGKSTLAYACARAGWTYLSDDCAALLINSDSRVAIGRPRQIRFRTDAPRLFAELEGLAARTRPTGKLAIEVDPSTLGIRTRDRASVDAIVFLERGPGAPSIGPVSAEAAFERIVSDLPAYGDEVDALHERAVRRICSAPAHFLRYDSLADGVRLLSAL